LAGTQQPEEDVMIRYTRIAATLLSATLAAGIAHAQTVGTEAEAEAGFTFAQSAHLPQTIITELEAEGYSRIEVSRTLLGRTMLRATGAGKGMREVVIHPRTGEILRDVVQPGRSDEAPRSDRAGGREDRGPEFGRGISEAARSGEHRGNPGSMGAEASGGVSAEARGRGEAGGVSVDIGGGANAEVGASVGVGRN